MEGIRTAIIGVGNMGLAHASCLWEGNAGALRLSAVCDVAPERLALCRERFPGVRCFANWRELIAQGEVQAVIIATPHPLHGQIAAACLDAGLHTLVEKPADISLSRAQAISAAARRSGKVYAIMLNQRTNPLFRRCREIVQGGELGALKRSVWIITNWYRTQHYYDSGAWRATWGGEGGGVLLNQAPHNLDLWQWICGMPQTVTAWCEQAKYHRIEVEDEATLMVRYAGGATGLFITSTGEYPGTNRLEISGTRGKLVLENGVLKWWKLQEPEDQVRFASQENFARLDTEYVELRAEEPESAHPGILRNFAAAIVSGEPLISPGWEGERELTLSNAAYLSQWQGNRPVELPFDTALFDQLLAQHAATSIYDPARAARGQEDTGEYSERWQVRW